jgi:hypothetical protein
VPVAGEQPDAHGIPACHQPIAVVLDLVDPVRPGRRALGSRGQARLDEAAARRRGRYAVIHGGQGRQSGDEITAAL